MEIPFAAAILIVTSLTSLLIKRRFVIEFISVVASVAVLLASVVVSLKVSAFGTYSPFVFLAVDSLGAIVMLIIACVGLATTIYSIPYLRRETAKGIIG